MGELAAYFASPFAPPIAGILVGFLAGYSVRRSRLCTFGAIEDALIGNDWRRMKIFGLALAIALVLTQFMISSGALDAAKSSYIPLRMPWLSIAIGSILFGLGMAYVGTCAFGTLVRLGGGDLRGLVTILVFSIAAYATLRGVLAPFRITVLEQVFINGPGGGQVSLPDLIAYLTGSSSRMAATLIIGGGLAFVALADRRLWGTPRLLTASIILGLGVAAGWYFTGVAPDPFADQPVRVESLTFVAPTSRAILLVVAPDNTWMSFGVASVAGVVIGSLAHALRAREFRWDAYDDHYEMRRHITGALFMGVGGILAGGCTIGQGLSAGSMFSLTWPLAMAGMILGARLGLGVLLEGSMLNWLRSHVEVFRAARSRGDSPAE